MRSFTLQEPSSVEERYHAPESTGVWSRSGERVELGAIVRRLREERGLSGSQLARQVQVSRSFVSQIERGVSVPSVEVLWRIARALDVPIGVFFGDDHASQHIASPPSARVVRSNKRKVLRFPNSPAYELLSPHLSGRIELLWVEFEPGATSPEEPYIHEGEECLVVITGEMTYWVNGEEYVLGPGDSLYIASNVPHRAMNRGSQRAVIISAVSPPSF